ncbi:MAG: 23S rRNA pseudouridine(1911/1915/1917) synthase RluD [Panacagrimonas sp.]
MVLNQPPLGEATDLRATVPEQLRGQRLDLVASRLFEDFSRVRLRGWIEDGRLCVNGEVCNRSRRVVSAGDFLLLRVESGENGGPADTAAQAQAIALNVVHADADIAVIHKPAGLTVHPGAGQADGTLQNALLHHFPQTRAVPRAGIVHRLDKDTSGLLVVALSLPAHTHLVPMIAAHAVEREYDAIVSGDIVAGATVDAAIGRHPRDRLKMAVTERGRRAVTHYRVQEKFPFHTHLRVQLETGRTHQIRVHLSHIRHPIVGDALYGGRLARGKGLSEQLRQQLLKFPRQALHARRLSFDHPVSKQPLSFTAEMPDDMNALLQLLRSEMPV